MTLTADRFLITDERAIDLATGDEVSFVTSTAGGVTDQARWLARCERFLMLRHRAIAQLVDYGLHGEHQRFEAWRVSPRSVDARTIDARATACTTRAADAFFRASRLTTLDSVAKVAVAPDGRSVVVPDPSCGYDMPEDDAAPAPAPVLDVCGIRLVDRPAVSRIADLLIEMSHRPRAIALFGSEGAGVRTAAMLVSRAARLQGVVPLAIRARHMVPAELLRGRTLLLIHQRTSPQGNIHSAWEAWLDSLAWAKRGHVLLLAGRTEVPHVAGLDLGVLSDEQLREMVQPACTDDRSTRVISDAVRRARGCPGAFVDGLWKKSDAVIGAPPQAPARWISRAAEARPAYGMVAAPAAALPPCVVVQWPASNELEPARQRLDAALRLLDSGRRAPGERGLRQAIGALARRHDWRHAGRGALALAAALLGRGRVADAGATLTSAREYVTQAADAADLWLDLVLLAGHHASDEGRLEEAESLLTGGLEAARALEHAGRETGLRLALARCLFWRGRFDDADRVLRESLDDASGLSAVPVAIAWSRVAVGLRDPAAAVRRSTGALMSAEQAGDQPLVAAAAQAAAFAHLAIGDFAAADHDMVIGLHAARVARQPLRALKIRLLHVESLRRNGQKGAASALLARTRTRRIPLPATLRARSDLLLDLLHGVPAPDAIRRRGATLPALSLFAAPPGGSAAIDQLAVDDILEILRCCQSADEAGAILRQVCERLRVRLQAAAIAFVSADGVPLASDGGRLEKRIAERVIAMGQTIPPHAIDGSIEGGAAVRYAGGCLASLVARWTLGAPIDTGRAAAVLTLAATAAGPLAAEAIAKVRQQTSVQEREKRSRLHADIVGESRVMDEVRRAIERASTAPFPVLIEGESGSGKELVARAVHRGSPRRDRPFCSVNCAALPDDLVESELFGHARGAFTGAVAERPGVFEEAHTGTLFLDEIGELSARAQAKVLRTIQEGELRRVGENVTRRVDVRIVAATNRELKQEVAAGRFRLDLFYRLDVLRIAIPPLRDRAEDIALLAELFWRAAAARIGSKAVLPASTLAALSRYHWPGNVRELQNVLVALAVHCPRRGVVPPTALPPQFQTTRTETYRLDAARRSFEERFIRAALVRSGGRRSQTAEELGITRQGLTKLMTRLGISDA